ncbi:MAG: SusC/RagA family TonB-linked outer membrane protein, partial [Bacteroidetes bacterium]
MKKTLLRSLAACLMLLCHLAATAQTTATGKVADENGNPLPGATIKVKSTTVTTATDANGAFSIKVPSGNAKLEVSYIGFATKVVAVGNGPLDIKLAEDNSKLNEVVVTGLATTVKRTNSANSVATIS